MKIQIPEHIADKKELFKWLVENKKSLIAQKKAAIKYADAFQTGSNLWINEDGALMKCAPGVFKGSFKEDTDDQIERTCIINTTNWYDSHGDVHIDGIWKKSLSENSDNYLCQEHDFSFAGIITDEVKAVTKKMSWRDLSLEVDGNTEALTFIATIHKDRNEFMFNQYRKNRVKNHSVGMRYMEIFLAVNDENWKDEFAVWNKYYDRIANKADLDAAGYFFAVTQAKVIEGSAVVRGSNVMTPTLANNKATEKWSTVEEPTDVTPEQPQKFDVLEAIKKTTFLTS